MEKVIIFTEPKNQEIPINQQEINEIVSILKYKNQEDNNLIKKEN